MYTLSLAAALLFSAVTAYGQTKVSGKVTSSEDGGALPGATVLVKGTTTGIIADDNGQYSIPAKTGDVLVFSFLGFAKQEITLATGQTTLDVVLQSEDASTEEVIITALGIKKDKARLGYAVQEVNGADLVKAREPNAINGLVGKVAGLTVGASPELLGAPNISLRGRNPIFVVDGVPINSDTWNINPDDIESYTVLKGPAAAALYGFRSKDGVIIINTKKGSKSNKGFSIEFNSSTMVENGFNSIPFTQDEYGPGDHGVYEFFDGRGGGKNDGDYDVWGPKFEGQLIPQYDSPLDPLTGERTGTPWVARGKDNLQRFLRPGLLLNNNLAISSSTDKYDLRFSTSYNHTNGLVPNTHLSIANFNIAAGFNFTPNLRLDANINYNRQFTENFPDVNYGPNSMIYNITIWGGADWDVDVLKDYWQPGKEGIQQIYAEYQRYNNPWFLAKEWLRGHYKTDIYGYTSLSWKISKDLSLMARTAVTTYDLFRNEKFPFSATVYGREQARGDYREDKRTLFENNTDAILTYDKNFGSNGTAVRVMAGGNLRTFQYSSSYITTNYLNVPGLYTFENSAGALIASNYASQMQVRSGFYSADVSVLKYLNLSTTGRWDQLSTLPVDNNVFFYPSAGVSTVISDYVDLGNAVNFLKLRGSFATVKEALTSRYIGATPGASYPLEYGSYYSSTYDGPSYGNSSVYSTPLVYDNQPGAYYTNTIVNADLQPASRRTTELGFELRMLENRLGFDVTYFNNLDGPQIFSNPISETSGYTSQLINAVKTRSSGVEVSIMGKPFKSAKGFNWEVVANGSTFREVFAEFPEGTELLYNRFRVGDRTDKYFDSGVAQNAEGQEIIDASGRVIRSGTAEFLGYSNPDLVWSLINKFSVKGFSLLVQFDGRVGGVITNYIQRQTFRGGRHGETVLNNIKDANGQGMGDARYQDYQGVKSWVGEGVVITNGVAPQFDAITGEITNLGEMTFAPNTTATFLQDWISRRYSQSEANLMSKTYMKLREVTLTYTVPQSVLGQGFIRGASVSFVGRNLLYFAEKKDIDLDQYIGSNYSSLQTPTAKRYGINLNLTF
ncbi:MAG: SusC/RagA family TonB-linked outer membrane protein [Bacteroidetes bacterium]|nr:MAG: SusC/RagA family TonB-linked outer membrane protein [Bacteroidota bacterium]